jgi:hypothetical protein
VVLKHAEEAMLWHRNSVLWNRMYLLQKTKRFVVKGNKLNLKSISWALITGIAVPLMKMFLSLY